MPVVAFLSGNISDLQGQGSRVRTPALQVLLANQVLTGVKSIETTNTSHFAADTFRITAALSGLPPALGLNYWDKSFGDELDVRGGFTSDTPLPSLVYGQVDDVEVDIVERTLTLTGRDLTARMIDTKTTVTYQDKRASDIATQIAINHGLTPNVQQTAFKVTGTYYQIINALHLQGRSDWDLLVVLAQHEGFDLWVSGHTLNFQPPLALTSDPYILLWSDEGQGNRVSNALDIKLGRSQTLARDVVVNVASWNQAQGKVFKATVKKSQANKASNQSTVNPQTYNFWPPNLDQVQVNQFANAKAEEITRHERVIHASLPGDGLLATRGLVKLVGTGSAWDQVYYPDTVRREISFERGYRMELSAKNHSALISE
jgi:phage protein D